MDAKKRKPTPPQKHFKPNWPRIILLLAFIALIIFTVYEWSTMSSRVILLYNRTFDIPANGSISFSIASVSGEYSLMLKNFSQSGASFYLTSLPVLTSAVKVLNIPEGSSLNVSTTGSNIADLNIKLLSTGTSGVSVVLTKIPLFNKVPQSSGISLIPAPDFIQQSTYKNSTIKIVTSTSTSTTSTSTTTINASAPLQQALTIASETKLGVLMNNYKQLYEKDTACNASIYNLTYEKYTNVAPSGQSTFANVSLATPRTVNVTVTKMSNGMYNVTYSTISHSKYTTGPAATLILNLSNSVAPVVSMKFEGIYYGLNFTIINSAYNFQSSIQNFCGAYIPYVPKS